MTLRLQRQNLSRSAKLGLSDFKTKNVHIDWVLFGVEDKVGIRQMRTCAVSPGHAKKEHEASSEKSELGIFKFLFYCYRQC